MRYLELYKGRTYQKRPSLVHCLEERAGRTTGKQVPNECTKQRSDWELNILKQTCHISHLSCGQ